MNQSIGAFIESGKGVLGVEFGSTRIKAVLIGEDHTVLAAGGFDWENQLRDGVWTYDLADVWTGLQSAYAALRGDVEARYGVKLKKLAAMGVSAMMHGYLAFDAAGRQLAPFRTWRNSMTGQAAEELTRLFSFNIPQRWTIAHLYQAILNGEEHVARIDQVTTLAGYVHWKLTGRRVVGVGEGAGILPIDPERNDYDQAMVDKFEALIAPRGLSWRLRGVLPAVLGAGEDAGCLTPEGALLLDPTGETAPGAPLCPPEGDAGTGMTATNSVAARTGNVSAGTSVFAMVVLERPLSRVYPEIDMVTTPTGKPVAMVHCNNCTSDINAWAGMLGGFLAAMGRPAGAGEIYPALFQAAMRGAKDCGGVVNCCYVSGETITDVAEGRPMLVRTPDAELSFENFARSLVLGAVTTLASGMRILAQEQVRIDVLLGHGGFFKTPGTAQKLLAAALDAPVSVMENAGEGGAWGMALLAAYRVRRTQGETLEAYLSERVFGGVKCVTEQPDAQDAQGFAAYLRRFDAILPAERAAVASLKA